MMNTDVKDVTRVPCLVKRSTTQALLGLLVCLMVLPVSGQEFRSVPITVFGDGDPYNGIEDSREPVMGGRRPGMLGPSAGAIKCDGQVRGTAMVVDTRALAPEMDGVVLLTAAHVMYDLVERRRFKHCEFQFLALGAIEGYTAGIDPERIRLGNYDPGKATSNLAFGEGDWAFLYVKKRWKNYRADESLPLRDFAFEQLEAFQQAGGEIRLVALDMASSVISESRACTVVESSTSDLGGGTWKGQLLDDCDSAGGASGGGFVAVHEGQQFLVGIRTGSHWSKWMYPESEFPSGPPDGSKWDAQSNTNFGRAIDEQLILELSRFVDAIVQSKAF